MASEHTYALTHMRTYTCAYIHTYIQHRHTHWGSLSHWCECKLPPKGALIRHWWDKLGQTSKQMWISLRKLKVNLSNLSCDPLLGVCPKFTISCSGRLLICLLLPKPIASPATVAKAWNQSRCPSTDEWAKKAWHMSTKELYSSAGRPGSFWKVERCGKHHVE